AATKRYSGMRIPHFLHATLAALGLILGAALSHAQEPPYAWDVTVTNASAQAIGHNSLRKRIIFFNGSATATVACVPALSRRTGASLAATINGAGSITLLPYGSMTIDGGVSSNPVLSIPSAWNCISSAGSSPLTIFEFE